jgi:cysteine synthase A
MNRVYESALDLIGNTPMIKLKRISSDIPGEVWAKLEFFNPSGSVKDRIAKKMIEEAELRNDINKDTLIIEPTSGNTGIALSLVCALKGYKMIAVMPEAVSRERKKIVELFGGQVELTECIDKDKGVTKEDIECVMDKADELIQNSSNSYMPNQFTNEDNPKAHSETTAVEIINQTDGNLKAFVAACGTGGTFSGVSRVLAEKYPQVKRVVVEPAASAVMSGCSPGYHKIQGIGEGFIPETMCVELANEVVCVSDDDALKTARRLWKEEGIMAGISSGANVFAALEVGKKLNENDVVVTLIPDNGMRYLSVEELLK